MSFRLLTIFYVFAVVAAALATFGPAGILAASIVLGFWGWVFYATKRQIGMSGILVVALLLGILVGLLLPAMGNARAAAQRNQCANNLKQIALALLNYESAKRTYPPPFLADAGGKPMHSWRVLILPYLEELPLYQKYNFKEPWDGPNNRKLAAQFPEIYRCPSQPDDHKDSPLETNYFAVVAPETVFPSSGPGRSIRTISDGTSKTIMVIEASGLGVNWMEPRDLTVDEAVELLTTRPRSGHRHVSDGFLTTTYFETSERNVAFCDGSVHWIGQFSDAETAKALLTAAGGERVTPRMRQISPRLQQTFVAPKTTTVVKWGKVWGLSLFVVLSLLPAVWVRRTKKLDIASEGPSPTGNASIGTADANVAT